MVRTIYSAEDLAVDSESVALKIIGDATKFIDQESEAYRLLSDEVLTYSLDTPITQTVMDILFKHYAEENMQATLVDGALNFKQFDPYELDVLSMELEEKIDRLLDKEGLYSAKRTTIYISDDIEPIVLYEILKKYRNADSCMCVIFDKCPGQPYDRLIFEADLKKFDRDHKPLF